MNVEHAAHERAVNDETVQRLRLPEPAARPSSLPGRSPVETLAREREAAERATRPVVQERAPKGEEHTPAPEYRGP